VLLAVALSLGRMVDTTDATLLWPPLETLLTLEETTIRQAATASSLHILRHSSSSTAAAGGGTTTTEPNLAAQEFGAMVHRLATKEWFTARISAAGLLSAAYAHTHDTNCITLFAKLCRDETPMVRRIAAKHLGEFCKTLVEQGRHVDQLPELLPLYQELASIDQPDSVRLQTTENCVWLGQVCHNDPEVTQKLIPLIVATIDDRSWRVRWTAASKFASVVAAFTDNPVLIDAYEKLLQDPEAEVRTAATMNLALVSRTKAVAERLVQRVTSLTEDDSEHVRAALALVATELAPMLGRDSTITYVFCRACVRRRDVSHLVFFTMFVLIMVYSTAIWCRRFYCCCATRRRRCD
jgi:serine/threonine-protein phosphatase 2A regulatory subunit A